MASGNHSLRLSTEVTWEGFSNYAAEIVRLLDGVVLDRADSPVERVWTASIEDQLFWVSFDDFALGVSLDPQDAGAASLIPGIREKLLNIRDKRGAG